MIKLILLADKPDAADVVARWYFDEWAHEDPGMTLERVREKVAAAIDRESAPMIVLAMDGETVVGAAELKIREMDIYPDKEFWLGGVYVDETGRGKGVASALVREVLARARKAGIEELHLQTEKLDGGLYRKHGFRPIEKVTYKGRRVLVMTAEVGECG